MAMWGSLAPAPERNLLAAALARSAGVVANNPIAAGSIAAGGGIGGLAAVDEEWQGRAARFLDRDPLSRAARDAYRSVVPPGKPDWYNPTPSLGTGAITTPDRRADMLLPPPANAVQGASNAVFGSLAQPFREASDAIGGRLSEQEAKDFAFNAAIGLIPMGRGLQGVRMGVTAPRAANAVGKPATAFDDAMLGVAGAMGEVQPAPMKIPTAANYSQPGIRAYHGSTTLEGPFSPYGKELGPHFGTLSQANDRVMVSSDPWNKKDTFKEGARTVPVEIAIKNPLEVRDVTYWEPASVLNQFGKMTNEAGERMFTPSELSPAWSNYRKWKKSAFLIDERDPEIRNAMLDQIRALTTSKGYDAIKYNNLWEGQTSKASNVAYIPLKRGTVKSAISGNTLFAAPAALGAAGFGSLVPQEPQ